MKSTESCVVGEYSYIIKLATFASIHIHAEAGRLSTGQHDGLNAQRFTIFIVDHKLTGGRTDRTEDRVKSERVCREA